MGNTFLNLPAAAANGTNPAVDVSAMGSSKTIVCSGSWILPPTIVIEFNNDPAAGGTWATVTTFSPNGIIVVDVACKYMRVNVQNFQGGQAPVVNIGGTADGTQLVALAAPAGDGVGAAVDVSALGLFKTFQVGTVFGGSLIVEVSVDGGTTWGQVASFQGPGSMSVVVAAQKMRTRRVGVPTLSPGLPDVNVGATIIGGGSGGGGSPSTWENVLYTATGVEGTDFTVPIGVVMTSVNYDVYFSPRDAAFVPIPKFPNGPGDRTTATFRVVMSAAPAVGDTFSFLVIER